MNPDLVTLLTAITNLDKTADLEKVLQAAKKRLQHLLKKDAPYTVLENHPTNTRQADREL